LHGSTAADAVVLVFARAPRPGRAKTRLVPRLGEWGAARLQWRLTRRAVRLARAAFPRKVELHVTAPHGLFRALRVKLEVQKGRDLGERMHNALAAALRRHRVAILVGSDCPVLTARDLRRAARLLGGHDVVLAPAEDGGYALIGMARARESVFRNVAWGTSRVLSETLSNIEGSDLSVALLRTVWDVDRPADLERLRSPRFA
jgi:rSAM/selenodomain-associated transferase 1